MVLVAKTARPIAYNAKPVNSGTMHSGTMHSVKMCLWLKKMQMWMNAGFTGKTVSNATLCLKIKIISKHIVDTTFSHRSSKKLCVTMRTFMYFGICKERTAFVLVSQQVGMYLMTGLMSDSQVLMVPPQILSGITSAEMRSP